MINLLGLCKHLRDNYPIPADPAEINNSIFKYLGHEAPDDVQMDIVKALSAKWKRNGWSWDAKGAVKTEEGEQFFFHKGGVSIIKEHEIVPDLVRIKLIKKEDRSPRVIWFNDLS